MNKYLLKYCFCFLIFACNNQSLIDIQEEVFNDIFYKLIKNSTQDYRKIIIPSPELIKLRKQGKIIPQININDDRKMLVVINDSIGFPKKKINYNSEPNDSKKLMNFDIKNFKYNFNDIFLISKREYEKNSKVLDDKYYFGGFLSISNIIFDDSMNSAYLFVSFSFSKLNGQENKIYIKKINNRWKIVSTELKNLS